MAIKYVCDFCGQEGKSFHKEFSTGEIICDNCYEHLKKQTWRLAEEPAELEKAKESIRQESQKIESQRKELEKERAMDKIMSIRYRNGFYAVIRLYNQMVKALDDAVPKGFLFRRNPFTTIPEENVCDLEQRAIDDVIREVERNFHGNFDYLFDNDDPLRDREALRLNDIPTVNLPWNKDN